MANDKLKILLLTNFTRVSENAINYAIELFSNSEIFNLDAQYILVHAFKPWAPYANTPSIPVIDNDAMERELKEKLEVETMKIEKDVRVKSRFEFGSLSEVVDKIVKNENLNLIVMGSRERSDLERITFGANTMEVATLAKYPVLAIPGDTRFKKPENLVLATDCDAPDISKDSKKLLINIFSNNVKLDVLHIFPAGEKQEQDRKDLNEMMKDTALHQFFSHIEHSHHPIVNNNIDEGIASFIEKKNPSILGVIPRNKGFFEKIFHAGITEKMVYKTQIPVLVLQ